MPNRANVDGRGEDEVDVVSIAHLTARTGLSTGERAESAVTLDRPLVSMQGKMSSRRYIRLLKPAYDGWL